MKTNKIIWVDLDEVLAELLNYELEFHNYKVWNKILTRDLVSDYYIHNIKSLNITREDSVKWYTKAIKYDLDKLEIKPVKWAKEKLKNLKYKWYKLIIVTARDIKIKEYTTKWVKKYYWNLFDDIVFANHFTKNHKDKSEICKDLSITTFIEDYYDYALDIANSWINTFLLEKPWNSYKNIIHPKISKIKSWKEFNI